MFIIFNILKNPSIELESVKQDFWIIKYILQPSEQVQLEAIKQNSWSIQYINNLTNEIRGCQK